MEISGHFLVALARSVAALALALMATAMARAETGTGLDAGLEKQVKELALAGAKLAGPGITRVDIELGQLDHRLRLAPCPRVEPYLPTGTRLWGKARIGLRCIGGAVRWNVYLPITVRIYGRALVAALPLGIGSVVRADDLIQAEVDLAEDASAAVADSELAVGRTMARAVNAGQSLRLAHLKPRQWFAAGETVKVVAMGAGFSVAGEGQALTPGMEGQPARVRTESGRVLTGVPTAEWRIELHL